MSCKCNDDINERLAPYNGKLQLPMFTKVKRVFVEVAKLDDKPRSRKPPLVQASFCPFCGVEYEKDTP